MNAPTEANSWPVRNPAATYGSPRSPTIIGLANLPPQVRKLAPREREVATLVYSAGSMTARQIGKALSVEITNAAIRSMLGRLVRKGILKYRRDHSYRTFVYSPALNPPGIVEIAFRQLADDYFDGSAPDAASAMMSFLQSRIDLRPHLLGFDLTLPPISRSQR